MTRSSAAAVEEEEVEEEEEDEEYEGEDEEAEDDGGEDRECHNGVKEFAEHHRTDLDGRKIRLTSGQSDNRHDYVFHD